MQGTTTVPNRVPQVKTPGSRPKVKNSPLKQKATRKFRTKPLSDNKALKRGRSTILSKKERRKTTAREGVEQENKMREQEKGL